MTLSTPDQLGDIKVGPAVIREVHQLHGSCRLRPALSFVALPGRHTLARWLCYHLSVLTPKPRRSPAGAYFFEKSRRGLGNHGLRP